MLELSEIREDLKEIRYYYAHKDIFEKASKQIGEHSCIAKIVKYNDVIRFAPARLYELYVSLYLENNTLPQNPADTYRKTNGNSQRRRARKT